jgi:hypothetical protein
MKRTQVQNLLLWLDRQQVEVLRFAHRSPTTSQSRTSGWSSCSRSFSSVCPARSSARRLQVGFCVSNALGPNTQNA